MTAIFTKYFISKSMLKLRSWSSQYSQKCLILSARSPHKNAMFLSFYRTATMIVHFFIKTAIIIEILTKMSYLLVFIELWSWLQCSKKISYFWLTLPMLCHRFDLISSFISRLRSNNPQCWKCSRRYSPAMRIKPDSKEQRLNMRK